MSWTNLDEDQLLSGKPYTGSEALASYRNPIGLAEGVSGAPKVRGAALGSVFSGLFETAGSAWSATFDLHSSQARMIFGRLTANAASPSTQTLLARFSTDGGSSFGSAVTLVGTTGLAIAGEVEFDLQTGTFKILGASGLDTNAISVPADTNAMQIRTSGSSPQGVSGYLMLLGGKA